MKRKNQEVNIIYLGYGDFGEKSLARFFIYLQKNLKTLGISINLYSIVDKDPAIKLKLEDRFKSIVALGIMNKSPIICLTFPELISNYLEHSPPQGYIIVYDATASQYHFDNMGLVKYLYEGPIRKRIYYFGEKPLFLEREQLDNILDPNFPIWCNFIELENKSYKAVMNYLHRTQDFQIKKLRFWRLNSIGAKKIFSNERPGVTGGSLEDKAIHDLAITIALLSKRPNKLTSISESEKNQYPFEIVSTSIPHFMPANLHSVAANLPFFMTARGETINRVSYNEWQWPNKISDPTSDASFFLKIKWHLENKNEIDAEYYASWLGLSDFQDIFHFMENLDENWIDSNYEYIYKKKKIHSDIYLRKLGYA
jgi:hypothetical protein